MQDLKISLITVVYNAETTIGRCIESVISQNFKNVEYIIIDACSTDKTKQIISRYSNYISIFRSEPDNGIYDAMNKGIKLAHGDVIGTLNADDFFADNSVLDAIANAFIIHNPDIVYGNLDYVNPGGKVIRRWRSDDYTYGMFNWGWMPPHPTFYCKAGLFKKFGEYKPEYGTAADYELMLRFMHTHRINAFHLNKVIVKMTIGGISNKSYRNRLQAFANDSKAMRNNNILFPVLTLVCKPLRKLFQFL
ncbi:MAG: glycosyltransferase [Mucilaginibacter sp.]|nr:glycosyltransferase [Mucilaginibacter sp.]